MKAGLFDASVGIALEPFNGTIDPTTGSVDANGSITVFVDLQQGVDTNALGQMLLSVSHATSTATSTITTTPFDFVGSIMGVISSRLATLTGSTSVTEATTTNANASSTNAIATVDIFASQFLQSLFKHITAWFADATNGIGDFFANRVHTQELCISDTTGSSTCITKNRLDALLVDSQAKNSPPPGGGNSVSTSSISTSTNPTVPPTITVNGANPATIQVGDTYADLGATVTDIGPGQAGDNNLGFVTYVNGILVTNISLNTSSSTAYEIDYVATDQLGNTATSTRTVVVMSPSSSATTDTTNASSTVQ
jgi:hypothetical protein